LTIFHYHQIELSRPQVLADERRPDIQYRVLAGPLALRQCAESLASVWSGDLDVRAEPSHWQCRWQDEWGGYTRVRRLSPTELTRLHELIRLLEDHPFVARLHADGSQPFRVPPDHSPQRSYPLRQVASTLSDTCHRLPTRRFPP
jgi:hypothetical protein